MTTPSRIDRLQGLLLGTALGDALGLPMEGLGAADIERRFGVPIDRYHLVGRRGFVSDDTEQAALVAEALLGGRGDLDGTVRCFRMALRAWFLRLPFGIGWSTLRACLRLCFGARPSGVRSAGNGAAMRSAVVGAVFADEQRVRRQLAVALACVTHTDARAVEGAAFVAELAAECARGEPGHDRAQMVRRASEALNQPEVCRAVSAALELAATGTSPADAAEALGTTGFVVHTIGLATYVFIRNGETPLACIQAAIAAGGDTDTTAAVVGGWAGALHGASALPADLVGALHDGPFGPSHLRALAIALDGGGTAPHWSALAAMGRNLALYPVVLWHGLRRLLPARPRRMSEGACS